MWLLKNCLHWIWLNAFPDFLFFMCKWACKPCNGFIPLLNSALFCVGVLHKTPRKYLNLWLLHNKIWKTMVVWILTEIKLKGNESGDDIIRNSFGCDYQVVKIWSNDNPSLVKDFLLIFPWTSSTQLIKIIFPLCDYHRDCCSLLWSCGLGPVSLILHRDCLSHWSGHHSTATPAPILQVWLKPFCLLTKFSL